MMTYTRRTCRLSAVLAASLALLLLPIQDTAAQTLRAFTTAGGGTDATGSTYRLRGTAGQPATGIVGSDPFLGHGFWYAARNVNVKLPVELAGFTAIADGRAVRLTWQTASETNNAGFEVERSVEGVWQTLSFVEGQGTTGQPQAYRFEDADLPFTVDRAVYRLKQLDHDGTFAYSDEVEVRFDAPERLALHSNFPNPFARQTTIRYELPEPGPVRLAIYDALGRAVTVLVDAEQTAGRKELHFDGAQLASGVYFVRLVAGTQIRTQRLTVVR